jgi:hypothetical protein
MSRRIRITPSVTVELRPQPAGTIVYALYDNFSRCIGASEVTGTSEDAIADAREFERELARQAGEVRQ